MTRRLAWRGCAGGIAVAEKPLLGEFTKGLLKENTLFVAAIGICPSLAATTALKNAASMGVAVIFVLVCSNVLIAALRKSIPPQVRIPCFIVIIGSFVTMVEMVFKAKMPREINESLGIFIPLIVVNCIILYRAEAFAYGHGVLRALLDGLGVGIGYMLAICLVASLREVAGNGTIWGYPWVPVTWPVRYVPAAVLTQAPGAFLVLGTLMAFFKWLRTRRASGPGTA
jgi:electron transport complex protein RnfE